MPRATATVNLDSFQPIAPTLRKAAPRHVGWLAEIKFDGYRTLA